MKKLNLMIELIYRNICFSNSGCTRCIARDKDYPVSYGNKNYRACSIHSACVYDLIGKEMFCIDCKCYESGGGCKLLASNVITQISTIQGYWRINMK